MQTRPHTERFSTGVIVIGAGAAGLRASIELAERGIPVLCLTRRARAAGAPAAIIALASDTPELGAAGRLVE